MEIQVNESTVIRPAQETPKHRLRTSDLDLLTPPMHVPTVTFYRRLDDSANFFEARLLKEALSKVLVPFYPMAGRLGRGENDRIEIHCNGEGVLFMEAETSSVIDDFGDFSEGLKLLPLVPTVDNTKDLSFYPLLLIQVTHFKCGGVCLGVRMHHILVDGTSAFHFINSWAEMTRGVPVSIPPFIDRTLLEFGIPKSPKFHHIEYDPPPTMNTSIQNLEFQSNPKSISTTALKLSLDQINTLKAKANDQYHGSIVKYSRFGILAAHIWRCMCKARGLPDDQASKLYIPTDGRFKLNPPLPSGFIGNVIFTTSTIALSGDVQSEPLSYTVERVHGALKRMDDEYLKSALAYVKQQPDPTVLKRGGHTYKCPNLNIVNLANMPLSGADFGWGRPLFVRLVNTYFEGATHIYPSPTKDGSLLIYTNLETHQMQLFKKSFYEIF